MDVVGYRFGGSDHGLTVPTLKRLMDPSLYPSDLMVATAQRLPTLFYRVLATLLPSKVTIPAAFFAFYLAATAAMLAGAYRIGRWFGGPAAGVATLLITFPLRNGLDGEPLHRIAFSHAHLAAAVAIWAIVFFLEGRRLLPLLLLWLVACLHLLYSAYVLVGLLLVVLTERRRRGVHGSAVLVTMALLPLIALVIWSSRAAIAPEWLRPLGRLPLAPGLPGGLPDGAPAAASLLALGALALSRLPADRRALVALLLVGAALQLTLGTIFTDLVPLQAVRQYQPRDSWRFLVIVLFGLAATLIVDGWRAGGLARVAALVTGALLVPGLEPLLPVAVFLQATVGRPVPAVWARVLAAGILAVAGAWSRPRIEWAPPLDLAAVAASPTLPAIAGIGLLLVVGRGSPPRLRRRLGAVAAVSTLLWLAPTVYDRVRGGWERGAWHDIQVWVRLNTPKSSVVLTPPQETGFRVFSERSVVGESMDLTQPFVDPVLDWQWRGRMKIMAGDRYPRLPDEQLLEIARQFGASYIVVPRGRRHRGLPELYGNLGYAVYRASSAEAAEPGGPIKTGGAR
jgi:hypothetical protein